MARELSQPTTASVLTVTQLSTRYLYEPVVTDGMLVIAALMGANGLSPRIYIGL